MKTGSVFASAGAWLLLAVLIQSCGRSTAQEGRQPAAPESAAVEAGHAAAGVGTRGAASAEEAEISDLDRPVEELFRLTCEHKMKTFECEECRYETGVVRVPGELLSGALVKTGKVAREHVHDAMQLTGEVRFDERRVSHVGTQAGGIIRRVSVTLGETVRKGEPLIEVESIAIGEAEGAYLEAQAALRLARRNHDRTAELRKEGITSEREFFQGRQELEAAEIRAESALGRLLRLGMSEADARRLTASGANSGRVVLRAPVAGTVLTLHAFSGETAKAEETLLTIGDAGVVWVWADLYERDVAAVNQARRGGKLAATVTVKAYPGEEFPGSVDLVSPAMEAASRTVKLRVEVKNPRGRLLAGMFANVQVFLPGTQEALAVSRAAVLEDAGRSFVFIHHHGEYYVRRPVQPGRSWGERVEILSGLRGGETVICDGSFLMKSDVLRSKMGAGCAD
ncbi:MAG: efflux RND transporter periplasmic adaptor subunit [Candidatus Eisenbacteria bacterium]|nr:efflux RND transporter periplasmic adaptor subunit [Candidatus Eisenbacteria bacterium]